MHDTWYMIHDTWYMMHDTWWDPVENDGNGQLKLLLYLAFSLKEGSIIKLMLKNPEKKFSLAVTKIWKTADL